MKASLLYTRKVIFLILSMMLAGNGIFSSSGEACRYPHSKDEIYGRLPLFVRSQQDGIPMYTINPDLLSLIPKTSVNTPAHSNFLNHHIMTSGETRIEDLTGFLMTNNPGISYYAARMYASYYYEESRVEGVNHDIAFSQMCLETGFLKFSGVVHADQNNFCGLGAVNQKVSGEYFPTKRHGIRAHIQHLKAYASDEDLENVLVDKRFKYVKRGTAKTVKDLTGKWAMDPEYSKKINGLLQRLYAASGQGTPN
jgi:hypothetical protein